MEVILAITVGVLYAAAVFMLLRRSLVKLIFGLALLGHASNLLIFAMGRVVRGAPPIIPQDAKTLAEPYADPLPQAFLLTAIVIGFGVQAFATVLVKRAHQTVGTDDFDDLTGTDRP